MTMTSSKIRPEHLNRLAIVYIRQSSLAQVRFHRESTERQYALQEKALSLGWSPEQIQIIDEDLGISGSARSQRQGFQHLGAQVSLGEVGAFFDLEISRLARSSRHEKCLWRCSILCPKWPAFPKTGLRWGVGWKPRLWGTLTHSRALGIVHNFAYTGAYVFGRYRDPKSVDQQGLFIHHTVRLPREKWEVFIPDHHPSYITRNQGKKARNRGVRGKSTPTAWRVRKRETGQRSSGKMGITKTQFYEEVDLHGDYTTTQTV